LFSNFPQEFCKVSDYNWSYDSAIQYAVAPFRLIWFEKPKTLSSFPVSSSKDCSNLHFLNILTYLGPLADTFDSKNKAQTLLLISFACGCEGTLSSISRAAGGGFFTFRNTYVLGMNSSIVEIAHDPS